MPKKGTPARGCSTSLRSEGQPGPQSRPLSCLPPPPCTPHSVPLSPGPDLTHPPLLILLPSFSTPSEFSYSSSFPHPSLFSLSNSVSLSFLISPFFSLCVSLSQHLCLSVPLCLVCVHACTCSCMYTGFVYISHGVLLQLRTHFSICYLICS